MTDKNETKTKRPVIPAHEFDKEYNTQWRKEMEFLRAKGIEYTFAKRVGDYKIPTYKYKKTPQLFLALAEFYNQQQFRKNMDAIDKLTSEIMPYEVTPHEVAPHEVSPLEAMPHETMSLETMPLKAMPLEQGYIEIQPDKEEEKLLSDIVESLDVLQNPQDDTE